MGVETPRIPDPMNLWRYQWLLYVLVACIVVLPYFVLDSANRKALLDFLERAAAEQLCTILYISHRLDEQRPFFRQHLQFSPNAAARPFRLTPSGLSV